MRRLFLLFPLLLLALAQGVPQVREVDEDTLYWFLVNNTREVLVVGLPPARVGEALRDKKVVFLLGTEKPPAWAKEAKVVRLGGGPLSGFFLLADGRFFVGRKEAKGKAVWVIVDSPQVAAVIQGYLVPFLR